MMSRSYRHFPGGGVTTSRSEKLFKRFSNRAWRHNTKEQMRRGRELPERHIIDLWSGPKDGKQYWGDLAVRDCATCGDWRHWDGGDCKEHLRRLMRK